MITLKVNGIEYDNFLSASCSRSMIEFTSEANFTIALEHGQFPPFLGNERCEVFIDDEKVMTGFIDIVSVEYSNDSHAVSYTARDRTADFADSSINDLGDLGKTISLKKIIEIVLSHLKLDVASKGTENGIQVINSVDDLKPFTITDDMSPDVGDNAFEYCEGYARKRQVLLTTNADGNIQLTRNSGVEYSTALQNSFEDLKKENNILSGSFNYDYTNGFRKYIVKSQLSKSSSGGLNFGTVTNKKAANQSGIFEDIGVREGRQIVIIAKESANDVDNTENAKWQANFQRVQSQTYSVQIFGHSLNSEIIEPNKLIKVLDNFAELDEVMTIESVSSEYSVTSGSVTTINLTDKDAFTLTVTEPLEKEKDTGKSGRLSFG